MRVRHLVLAWTLLAPAAAAQDERSVADLVRELTDPDWSRREAAQAALVERGSAVRAVLEAYEDDPDLEVRARIASLLDVLPPQDPFERFVWEAPYQETGEGPHPLPVPASIEEALRRPGRDPLPLLTEYGLAVHWKNLRFSKLSRRLPLENPLFVEWIRRTGTPQCATPADGGWLSEQFQGPFQPGGWSSHQIFVWAGRHRDELTPRARRLLREIEDSGFARLGGRGVCHYGCCQ